MRIIADLHVHSKYSMATSPQMEVGALSLAAKRKGISLLGTGDFTHPEYFSELKRELSPFRGDPSTGLYEKDGTAFVPTAEISCIYSIPGKGCKRVHVCVCAPSLEAVEQANDLLSRKGNLKADGRPVLGMSVPDLTALFMGVSKDFFVYPAHVWTPWFGALGSESGFDSLSDCFGDQWKHIHALETGLSSDPPMNWRVSALDKCTPLSNSDAHSPEKTGREANVFELPDGETSFKAIFKAIKEKDRSRFRMTVEFFPEEGKYHWDGHRNCGVSMLPAEAIKAGNKCPVCGKGLTLGVLHRVEALADRPEGFVPEDAIPFVSLVPLEEVVADALGKNRGTKGVREEYERIIAAIGSEFDALATASPEALRAAAQERVAEGILRVRERKLRIEPGFDGEYGKIGIFAAESGKSAEKKLDAARFSGQKGLGEFFG